MLSTKIKIVSSLEKAFIDESIDKFVREYDTKADKQEIASHKGETLYTFILPFHERGIQGFGSTDVGDVSYVVPTAQLSAATAIIGTPGHSWQQTAQSKSVLAHEGTNYAAKVMALTGVKFLENPELIVKAREELNAVTGGVYNCPIPKDVKPQP